MSGLLHPTDGQVDVLGFTPWDRRAEYLSQITLIMGQRQQLFWDLPAIDSFLVNKAVFGIDDAVYKRTVDLLTSLLDLGRPPHQARPPAFARRAHEGGTGRRPAAWASRALPG